MRALITAALLLVGSGVATAQETDDAGDPLARGIELFERLLMDEAREALVAALEAEGRTAAELAAIHLRLGIIAAAEGDAEGAEQSFVRLLAVDPEARLPPGMSPFVQDAFAQARERWGEARLHIAQLHPPALDEDEVALRLVGREDRASMGLALRLRWRFTDEGQWRTATALGLGPHRFELEGARPGNVVEYHAALLGARQAVLAHLGTPFAPRRATVRSEVGGELAWYERWYVWAGAGVVLAGVAVGLVLLLRPDADSFNAQIVFD